MVSSEVWHRSAVPEAKQITAQMAGIGLVSPASPRSQDIRQNLQGFQNTLRTHWDTEELRLREGDSFAQGRTAS